MPNPWDERPLYVNPAPHEAIAAALHRAGSKVTDIIEKGRPGQNMTVWYVYDCGCRRAYRADQRTRQEREALKPCKAHRALENLLTKGAEQPTMGITQEAE